jgi:hypothetical protein
MGLGALIRPNGPVDIINITTDPKPEPFYNLHTTGEHNFTVDGMVVHNFTTLRTVRTWIVRSFIGPFHQLSLDRIRKTEPTDRAVCV